MPWVTAGRGPPFPGGGADESVPGSWLTAAAACLLLSVPIECRAEPAPRLRRRPGHAWCVHFGSVLLGYTILSALCRRPFLAALLTVALWALLIAVNNAKYRTLREPFVFSDFALFSQALRYPRLYLPFLGVRRTAAGGLVSVSVAYLALTAEPGLAGREELDTFGWVIATGIAGSAALLIPGLRGSDTPGFDPDRDLRTLGLLTSLWLYRLAEKAPLPAPPRHPAAAPANGRGRETLPNLVAVQSESFFDARRLLPAIRPEVLHGFDRLRRESLSGRLAVPAWGANTMRTEFAFLSGIPATELGVHRFNPFRSYARRPLPGIASSLRALGYRTVCIHPHPVGFFGRDRVYPHLGFDRFIDIEGFRGAEKFGPYTADAAVAAKVAEVLGTEPEPLFVFAITMENHGPLHLEKVGPGDEPALYRRTPPSGFDQLTVYLRHLANADRMLTELQRLLIASPRESVLCFFGDHVPAMAGVYRRLDFSDARTDYLIWRPGITQPEEREIAVEELGELLLELAGFNPDSIGRPR